MTQLYEPATGAPLAEVELATEADVDHAVQAARAALELYLETKSVITATGSRPSNPFGL